MNQDEKMDLLMRRYDRGQQDMDTRRTRKNGWNDVVSAYMGKLPIDWPYQARTVDPRIRSTVLEKTARLLNAKLQGRLVPREGGDLIKAKINNAVLDYQWDNATEGGSMIEKVAHADQISRLFGSAFVYIYWDTKKESNEIKNVDPRDIFFDGAATHIRNARWVMYREFTTFDKLEARGYNVNKLKRMIKKGEVTPEMQSTAYESIVKANKMLENRVGEVDDPRNPIIEVVTQFDDFDKTCTIFLPRYGEIISEHKNPYNHGKIPFAQLRYYPLGDDIYGEIEVEPVLPLWRAINAFLCGTIDAGNLALRPPLKIRATGVRRESIEYGPGAHWIMSNPNDVVEMQSANQHLANFNAIYPALVAAYNTAMGDQSLGVSNVKGQFTEKTATEVRGLADQQNSRDQYNQLYLGEFLKDVMMMWLSNNKQYLFDDPTKKYHILKIIGKDNIKQFQAMQLDDRDIPDYALQQIQDTVMMNPEAVSDEELQGILEDVSVPTNPVFKNPGARDPAKYDIVNKFDVKDNGEEADLYITPDDMEYGVMDYIPDVKSMSAGAGQNMKEARKQAVEFALNPQVNQMLQMQGGSVNIKELLVTVLEDAGYKDAEGLFNGQQNTAGAIPGGPVGANPGQLPIGANGIPGMAGLPGAISDQPGPGGIPQPAGIPGQIPA